MENEVPPTWSKAATRIQFILEYPFINVIESHVRPVRSTTKESLRSPEFLPSTSLHKVVSRGSR